MLWATKKSRNQSRTTDKMNNFEVIATFGYLLGVVGHNVLSWIGLSYLNTKPLGMQTILDEMIRLLIQAIRGSVICVCLVYAFGPVMAPVDEKLVFTFVFMFFFRLVLITMLVAMITRYISIVHRDEFHDWTWN